MIKIAVDSREQLPYGFTNYPVATTVTGLAVGDYSLIGFEDRVAIERKTLADLIGCLTKDRARFERELAKAKGYDLFALMVEGSLEDIAAGRYRSDMHPNAAVQSLAAFMVRHRIPIVFAGDRAKAEKFTYSLLQKFLAEIEKRYAQARQNCTRVTHDSTA
jgi:DNA excision repair protein ERCC-4